MPFTPPRKCFNPRSPLPGSDAGGFSEDAAQGQVSIHAPRCRGAMLLACAICRPRDSFQSTLPVAGERCQEIARARANNQLVSIHAPRCRGAMQREGSPGTPTNMFQSTLPVAGERCARRPKTRSVLTCFNPRSPLPGSDAPHRSGNAGRSRVSIHAPRCRGAMRARMRRRTSSPTCFNPRSPLPGSDAGWPSWPYCQASGFQSTLPVAGERCDTTSYDQK